MALTKKHVVAFAADINAQMQRANSLRHDARNGEADEIERSCKASAESFARLARNDNPRFDDQRFYKACGF